MLKAADPFFTAIKTSEWAEAENVLSNKDYKVPYELLTELCNIGTESDERMAISCLAVCGIDRLNQRYGPDKCSVLHIALTYGNEYQLKAYHDSLMEDRWQKLCLMEDSRGRTSVDTARHIIESVKAKNWVEIKGNYYRDKNEEFWQDFDFDGWMDSCEWFLAHVN
jgi:hypothetical protein